MQINNISTGTSTLPNGTLINNVCYINQSTRPTTRPDGSALVVGDRWYNSATGVEGFWNGTYWLAEKEDISIVNQLITSSTNYTLFGYIPPNKQVLVSSITFSVQSSYIGDISNFYNIHIVPANRHEAYGTEQIINNIYQSNIPAQTNIVYPLNAVSPSLPTGGNGLNLGYGWNCYQLWATKTGTPSNFNFTLCVYAREIL